MYDMVVEEDGTVRKRRENEHIITLHGTVCAAIISKYAPQAEFCSLRIFQDETSNANIKALLAAMHWCHSNKIPIVHMSVGSPELKDYAEIRKITAKMISIGQCIVAANSNRSVYSAPACIGGVFGVSADKRMIGNEYKFIEPPRDFALISASSKHELTYPGGIVTTTPISNSYAAPAITAALCNILSKSALFSSSVGRIYRDLKKDAVYPKFSKPDFIDAAYILNPSGYHILKEHLFFRCIGEYCSLSDIPQHVPLSCENTQSLVYLPISYTNNDDLLCDTFDEILYGGELPFTSRLYTHCSFIWSEDTYKEFLLNFSVDEYPLKFPVVNIYADYNEAIDIMCQLRNLFISDGYQCVALSDHKFSYLYGVEYAPLGSTKTTALHYIGSFFDPDVAICCFQSDIFPNELDSDDFYVVTENYRDTINLNPTLLDSSENLACVKTNENLDLYKVIEKYFLRHN
jgi:hypothetical protein